MTLRHAVNDYIAWRRTHGAKFHSCRRLLYQFCEHVGRNISCGAVGEADVLVFLAGKGPLTSYRAVKYSALAGFYRYAISRGHAVRSPLPVRDDEPRRPRSLPPYVYSRNELQHLFATIDVSRRRALQLDGDTLRALLLLLYGAGLRFGEAQRLTLDDVDLPGALLTRTETALAELVEGRASGDAVFLSQQRRPYTRSGAYRLVQRCAARVPSLAGRRITPHTIRHTSACHLLQAGIDLNTIRAWLGHASLDTTNVYAEIELEMKAKAMALCDAAQTGPDRPWKERKGLMAFLVAL